MRISDWSSDVCSSDLFERALIRERQREGIAVARQRGAYRGRKRSLSDEMVAELHRRVDDGERKAVIARDLGISRETLYQYPRAATCAGFTDRKRVVQGKSVSVRVDLSVRRIIKQKTN